MIIILDTLISLIPRLTCRIVLVSWSHGLTKIVFQIKFSIFMLYLQSDITLERTHLESTNYYKFHSLEIVLNI